MEDERYCRRERRNFSVKVFSQTEQGRYIHEVPSDRHYSDGEQWYEPGGGGGGGGRVLAPLDRPDRDF